MQFLNGCLTKGSKYSICDIKSSSVKNKETDGGYGDKVQVITVTK